MKVIYIAGPYRAKNGGTIIENVRAAERVAMKYWRAGYAVLCPHLNSAFMDGVAPDAVFLEAGLEFVRRSDVVIVMRNHEMSTGTAAEIELAESLGKLVIYDEKRPEEFRAPRL